MKTLTAILMVCATIYFTVQTIRLVPIAPSTTCSSSSGLRLGWFENKEVEEDHGCLQAESIRTLTELGEPQRALFVACSHPGSRLAFGSVEECMRYSGDYSKLAVDKEEIERYCYRHSRKILRRLTFQRKRYYEKCMRG